MMFVILIGVVVVLSVPFLWMQRAPRPLTPAEARAGIKHRTIHSVIDVRSEAEWAEGHYENALHIPLQSLPSTLPRKIEDRSIGILFYCRTGRRAAEAARVAQELGYHDVWYLDEGSYMDLDRRRDIIVYQ
jgi:rhodanese-related sulfurtransferase